MPELERTIVLMRKVVERVQRENEALKKSSGPAEQDRIAALQQQNQALKVRPESSPCLFVLLRP